MKTTDLLQWVAAIASTIAAVGAFTPMFLAWRANAAVRAGALNIRTSRLSPTDIQVLIFFEPQNLREVVYVNVSTFTDRGRVRVAQSHEVWTPAARLVSGGSLAPRRFEEAGCVTIGPMLRAAATHAAPPAALVFPIVAMSDRPLFQARLRIALIATGQPRILVKAKVGVSAA